MASAEIFMGTLKEVEDKIEEKIADGYDIKGFHLGMNGMYNILFVKE